MRSLASLLPPSEPFVFRPYPASPERQAEIAAARKAEERRAAIARVERTGIPMRYRGADIAQCPKAARDYAEAFRFAASKGEPFGRNLMLRGTYGAGKTWTACAVLLRAMQGIRPNGCPVVVRFTTVSDLLRKVQAGIGRPGGANEVLDRYAGVGLLCLDDWGKERATEWAREQFFAMLNRRNADMLPTVLTTQYTSAELMARWTAGGGDVKEAQATMRRIAEDMEPVVFEHRRARGGKEG